MSRNAQWRSAMLLNDKQQNQLICLLERKAKAQTKQVSTGRSTQPRPMRTLMPTRSPSCHLATTPLCCRHAKLAVHRQTLLRTCDRVAQRLPHSLRFGALLMYKMSSLLLPLLFAQSGCSFLPLAAAATEQCGHSCQTSTPRCCCQPGTPPRQNCWHNVRIPH